MKNFIFFIFLFLNSFFGFTQTIEIRFDEYLSFNTEKLELDFYKIMEDDSININELLFGENKYIIDFKNETIDFQSDAAPSSSAIIENVEKKDGFIFIKVKDSDSITNEDVYVYLVINEESEKNEYPYFTIYYESAGITNGFIVMENQN